MHQIAPIRAIFGGSGGRFVLTFMFSFPRRQARLYTKRVRKGAHRGAVGVSLKTSNRPAEVENAQMWEYGALAPYSRPPNEIKISTNLNGVRLPGRSLRLGLCADRYSRLPQPENGVCDAILIHFSAVIKLAVCRNRCDTQKPTQRKTPQTIVWGKRNMLKLRNMVRRHHIQGHRTVTTISTHYCGARSTQLRRCRSWSNIPCRSGQSIARPLAVARTLYRPPLSFAAA